MRSRLAVPSPNETTRRATLRLLTLLGATGMAGLGVAGMAGTARAAAPGWPEDAFRQKTEADAVRLLYGKPFEASDKVTLEAPEIAENGAVVPISVSADLPGVTTISILVPENPYTLAASYKFAEGTMPSIGCRLKMAKTSNVVAIVESEGKLYAASKEVKVTLGGCGG
jgi:sulfur-oxidizing protein SoxY